MERNGIQVYPLLMPTTSVVVSMYNSRPETVEIIKKLFLPSVLSNASPQIQLIIIDDHSPLRRETQGVIDMFYSLLKKEMGNFVFLRNSRNLGFAASYNQGMKRAEGKVIVITNDDVYFPKDSLSSLSKILRSEKEMGAVGPVTDSTWSFQKTTLFQKIKDYSDKELERIELFAYWLKKVMKGKVFRIRKKNIYLTGFCLAIKKEALKTVGYFDERFKYAFFEDTDLCRKIQEAGFYLAVDGATFIEHGGTEGGSVSVRQNLFKWSRSIILNGVQYANKWKCYSSLPVFLGTTMFQGLGFGTITEEITKEAKKKNLWKEYLSLQYKKSLEDTS